MFHFGIAKGTISVVGIQVRLVQLLVVFQGKYRVQHTQLDFLSAPMFNESFAIRDKFLISLP